MPDVGVAKAEKTNRPWAGPPISENRAPRFTSVNARSGPAAQGQALCGGWGAAVMDAMNGIERACVSLATLSFLVLIASTVAVLLV